MRFRMSHAQAWVALLFAFVVRPCSAELVESRQVVSFDLDSVRYVEYAPLIVKNLPLYTHVQSQSLFFQGFDPSLGTLKNAYLSYQGTYGIEYYVKAGTRVPSFWESVKYGGDVGGFAHYDYVFDLTVSGAGGSTGAVIYSGEMGTQVVGPRYSGLSYLNFDGSGPKDLNGDWTADGKYLWRPWVSTGDLDSPLLSLADGLDVSGQSIEVILEKEITLFMVPFFSIFGDPDYSLVDNYLNKWSGDIALTYIYESNSPIPVPEPQSLLLTVTALLAGWGLRRTGGRQS